MAIRVVTLSTTDKAAGVTLSNGNLTATTATNYDSVRATDGKTTGKWYWEVKLDSGTVHWFIGIANKQYPLTSSTITGSTGEAMQFRAYYAGSGEKRPEATAYGTAIVVGDVIGVALDLDNGKLEFYKNGVSMGVSHTNLAGLGEVFPLLKTVNATTGTYTVNFGGTAFKYAVPNGYTAYTNYPLNKFLLLNSSGEVEKFNVTLGGKSLDSTYKGTGVTLSNNDKTALINGQASTVVAVTPVNIGKRYWEVKIDTLNANFIGVTKDQENLNAITYSTGKARNIYHDGTKRDTAFAAYSSALVIGDIISVLLDMDNGTLEFWKNGVSLGIAFTDLKSLTGVRPSSTTAVAGTAGTAKVTFRFVESEFSYAVPSGYVAYGKDLVDLVNIPSQTEQDFINRGMDTVSTLNPQLTIAKKQYIKNTNTTLGAGKTFTHPIDLARYKVNKITFQ